MLDKNRITSLVRAAQAGDALSFAELVRAYQDMAVAYATSILRDYHLAEDAAQEAFVEVYRELASLREPAAFARAAGLLTPMMDLMGALAIQRARDKGLYQP